ncbi:MAG: hypothetical protein ACC634_07025 [Hyphomicrobiales bacterium]
MRLPSVGIFIPLALIAAIAPNSPAHGQEKSAFARGDILQLGDFDIRLEEEKTRWGATRQGNIDLDKNTFLFGREDTYENLVTRSGIDLPEKGATIGIGMGFTF